MSVSDKIRNLIPKLEKKGFEPKKYGIDAISFLHARTYFILYLQENDNSYYRLFLPNFYTVKCDECNKALSIINEINIKYRIAKVLYMGNELCVSVESVFESESLFLNELEYFIGLSKKAAGETLEKIRGNVNGQ